MKKIIFFLTFLFILQVVLAQSKESAVQAIERAEEIIEEMKNLGLKVGYANDTLNEAKLMLQRGNYLAAKSLAEYVEVIRDKAIEVDKLIDEVEEKAYEAKEKGLKIEDLEVLLKKGIEYFEEENYDEAKELLLKCLNGIEEREKEKIVARISLKNEIRLLTNFLKENYPRMILSIIVFSSIFSLSYRRFRRYLLEERLRKLKKERNVIERLLKNLQRKYFVRGTISKKEYETLSESYSKKLIRVKKNIKVLESILKR